MSTASSNASGDTNVKPEEKEKEKKEIIPVVINPGEFDLEAYINNYTGHTKIARLIFIAERCQALEVEAYRMAIDEIKRTLNSGLYKALLDRVGEKLGIPLDITWIEATDKKASQLQERLELELNGYKTNLIKESIRMGHHELGDYYYNRGDLNSALKCYVRTRDYCTTNKHILQMCLSVIKVSIELPNYAHVVNYVTKAEQTPDTSDKVTNAKLKVCGGLANLDNKKYKMAARKLLETTIDLNNNFNDVIAPQDVALMGGLCALATFDRVDLKKKVIDNASFRNFLELTPDLREIINDFYASRYATCLKALDKIKPKVLLDIHLNEHVNALYQKIRNKALIQYFSPFKSIDLNTMAAAFNTNVAGLEKEISALIMDNSIQARIDSHNKRLYARTADQRTGTFEKTIQLGEDYQDNTKALLLRINLLKNDVTVKPKRDRDMESRFEKMERPDRKFF